MLNISQVILVRTDSNLCRKELTVHWSAPNSLIRSYLQPCTNSMRGDESEAVAPIIWLYQTVDAQKEEVFFPDLLITLRRHDRGSLLLHVRPSASPAGHVVERTADCFMTRWSACVREKCSAGIIWNMKLIYHDPVCETDHNSPRSAGW